MASCIRSVKQHGDIEPATEKWQQEEEEDGLGGKSDAQQEAANSNMTRRQAKQVREQIRQGRQSAALPEGYAGSTGRRGLKEGCVSTLR
jgi:hypothetical protein